jgi:hypothetical protein
MKKTWGIWVIVGLWAGLAYGGDDFNDSVRNKALWKVPAGNMGRLVETNTRLYYNALGASGVRSASWYWKTPYTLNSGDMLEVSTLICLPKVDEPTASAYLGLGLANGYLSGAKYVAVTVRSYDGQRDIVVSGDGRAKSFSLPQTLSVFFLVIRYNATTGKLTIWQRAMDYSWTSKAGAVNLNVWWAVPPGTPLVMAPYIVGQSENMDFTTSNNYYFDDFNVIKTIP